MVLFLNKILPVRLLKNLNAAIMNIILCTALALTITIDLHAFVVFVVTFV